MSEQAKPILELPKKGMPLDECIRRAKRYCADQGAYVLAMDVIGSQNHPNRRWLLQERLPELINDLNSRFTNYIVDNYLAPGGYPGRPVPRGFYQYRGDQMLGCLNNPRAVVDIREYELARYPDVCLYWVVAFSGSDKKAFQKL